MARLYDWHKNLTFFTENVVNNCPGYNVQMPEYVPMIWRKWTLGVDPGIPAGTKYILAYNEPDRADQANLTPQQAAEFWPNIEQLVNGTDIKLDPVPASSDFVWLDQFFENCSNCKVDYLAAHFYSCNENDILGYINRLSRRYKNRKVWLTEFACPTAEYSETFMANMLKRLEKNTNVFR
ncbi:ASL1-like protein [Mya arenaria]|uniref:ASL1-like protein n=1 Tax=Mya arenaria TaxID=6604 RepID=A0ABY7G216_MYAAR|nr:ASL1-like protein [Mya arenaria]